MGIEHKVLSLVRKFGTSNPYKIAKELDINLLEADLGEVKGYYTKIRRIKFIFINENLSKNEKIFTMAHELGHAVLHYNTSTPHLLSMKYRYTSKIESEADEFASILIEKVVTFHALRHTHASILLSQGVQLLTVSRRLGHADANITLKTYAHILDDMKIKEAQKIKEILTHGTFAEQKS